MNFAELDKIKQLTQWSNKTTTNTVNNHHFSDTRWEKKLRYSSNHQTIYSLLVKLGKEKKNKSPPLSWIPQYRTALVLQGFSFLKQPKKKGRSKIIFPPSPSKLQEKQWNPFFNFILFFLKSLPLCVRTVRRKQDMHLYRHFSLHK